MDAVADIASADRTIGSSGTVEAGWLPWLESLRAAPLMPALPPAAGMRLVIVAPHPDDEVLACGGWLFQHAQRGGAVAIVAVTDGEASHTMDSSREHRLAATRRLESERGLARLGVRLGTARAKMLRLGLPDGQAARHPGVVERALAGLLRPGDVVVTTWRFDGHPDHESTGREAVRACAGAAARCIEAPVWMWHWSRPADARIPWDRLRAVTLSAEAREAKLRALSEHATQLAPRASDGPVLDAAIVARAARDVEYYFA